MLDVPEVKRELLVPAERVATVDLNLKSLNVGSEGEAMAIAQIVWTLTENDKTIKGVKFLVNCQPTETLAGHVDASGVFKRDTLDSAGEGTSTLTSVSISNFTDGQTIDSPVVFTGTMAFLFFFVNMAKWVPYAWLGLLSLGNLATSLVLLPLAPLGVWIGVRVARRISPQLFYRFVLWGMFLTGCKLLWDGLH